MAVDPLSAALGVGKILGGLFGKKKKNPTPAQNILSQAQGARQAAEKYGFNPLTMLQYGQPGGTGLGGEAPLASLDLLLGGIEDVADEFTGKAAQQRAADQLNIDLAQLKLEQAKSGVIAAGPSEPNFTLGNRPTPMATVNRNVEKPFTLGSDLAPGREGQEEPVLNVPGFYEMNNAFTGGDIILPGEGPEGGIDDVAIMLGVGGPQAAYNWARKGVVKAANALTGTNAFDDVELMDAFRSETWNRPWFSQSDDPHKKKRPPEERTPGWEHLNFN